MLKEKKIILSLKSKRLPDKIFFVTFLLRDLFFEILKWKRKKNSSRQDIGFKILMVRCLFESTPQKKLNRRLPADCMILNERIYFFSYIKQKISKGWKFLSRSKFKKKILILPFVNFLAV